MTKEHKNQNIQTKTNKSTWFGGVTSLLASAVALSCPVRIPAVASLLASLGIGIAAKEQFIRPLLLGLLAAAVASFAWSAKLHRRWWVVVAGVAGGVLVYLGRYFGFGELWMNQLSLWAGTGVLIGTSVVNLRLKDSCHRCQQDTDCNNSAIEIKTMRKLWGAVLLILILATPGSAIGDETSREVEIKVQGLACPFCAYGLEKRLKKLEAVESVDVLLKTDDVRVKLKPGKSVTEEQLRQAIQKGGFTAKEIHFGKE